MLRPHLSKHVQQPNSASHLPAKDRGDHGVDATTAYPAMLCDANARQHSDEGHEDDGGHQEQAQEHTCVSLQQKRERCQTEERHLTRAVPNRSTERLHPLG